jgi:ferrochelatase
MNTNTDCQAVMLLGFGGPAADTEVRFFLDRVLSGRAIPRARYEEVVRHYQVLGGKSPYNEITLHQAHGLRDRLEAMGLNVPVVVGFLHAQPFIYDALRDLKEKGIYRALGIVLAAYRCEASWDRYWLRVKAACDQLGTGCPQIQAAPAWHDSPLFVAAVADRVRAILERLAAPARERAKLIFTAHSIPMAMAGRVAYAEQFSESARLVARQLGYQNWTLAYQSRSGNPSEPWLEPDVRDVVRAAAGTSVVIVPIGFTCDHVEVLYDLDIELAQVAREAGVTMVRAGTVGNHPKFLEMLASIAAQHLSPLPRDPH